jgi:methyl-accepting chemotaxis protein
MIEQIQQFFKDPAKVTRLMVVCFFGAVLMSGYFLYSLPNDLVYQGGMIDSHRASGVYIKLFVIIGLAFAFCYASIRYLQLSRKETIVYLDKKMEGSSTQGSRVGENQGQGSFNVRALQDAIQTGKTKEEKWQQGLNQLCHQLNAGQGALYTIATQGEKKFVDLKSGFALVLAEDEKTPSFEFGEGLIGQVAASGKGLYLDELPEGYAARIESGLGSALPKFLWVFPLKKENEIIGVVEVALFTALSEAARQQALEAGSILAEIS